MDIYETSDRDIIKRYGKRVRAIEMTNREYGHRYSKLHDSRKMKSPPSSGRIFPGVFVVRNLDTDSEYETWMPDDVFDEIYSKVESDKMQVQ